MRRLLFAGLGRLYVHRQAREDSTRRPELESFSPGILAAFDEITRATGKSGPYVAKCYELLSLLWKHKPQSILELGSGRTSLLFAAYAKRNAVAYAAYEQDPQWLELINDLTYRLHRSRPVELVQVETLAQGGRYLRPIPDSADFVYVDAPYVPGRAFPTFTGKPAYMDVPFHLKAGRRPNVIVVDGRTDTVDEILKFQGYRFVGSLDWARERGVLAHAIRTMRHSVFVASGAL